MSLYQLKANLRLLKPTGAAKPVQSQLERRKTWQPPSLHWQPSFQCGLDLIHLWELLTAVIALCGCFQCENLIFSLNK